MEHPEGSKKFKVLVVEDDAFMRDMICEILQETDYLIESAVNGADAFTKCMESQDYDLVVSDLMMPVMGGLELIKKLRAANSDVAMIILTGSNDVLLALSAIKSGADDYLLKDENVQDTIGLAVRRVLEKRMVIEQNRILNDFIKNALKKYISPEYVEMLINKPDILNLGGEEREITIVFTDIESFTTIAESLDAKTLVSHLNEYLDGMTQILLNHKGTLDKYVGDSLIAFWNAPMAQADHINNCLTAVLEMSDFSVNLDRKFKMEGKSPFKTRIGVNTGKAIVGNIGSTDRFNYTAIGDQVNLASRLEAMNKVYGTNILISGATYEKAKNLFRFRKMDFVRVKGKEKPVMIYELLGKHDQKFEDSFEEMIVLFERGMEAYRTKQWKDGVDIFTAALDIKSEDTPSKIYLNRCKTLLESPLPDEWDGVFDFRFNKRRVDPLVIKTT